MVCCKGLYFKAVVCNAGLEVAVKVLGLAFNGPASGRLGKLGFKVACDMVFTCRFVAKRLARYDAGAVIVSVSYVFLFLKSARSLQISYRSSSSSSSKSAHG